MKKILASSFIFGALLMNTPVHAAKPNLHVDQQVELDMSPADVWRIVSDYGRLQDWHPVVTATEIVKGTNNVVGAIRHLTFVNGGTLDERLTAYDPQNRLLSYTITAGEFPVSDYLTTIEVKSLPDRNKALLTWTGTFNRADWATKPAAGKDDAAAIAAVSGVYSSGLQAVEKIVADTRAIRRVIGFYADGGTAGDSATVAKAFHPSATMKFVRDDHLVDEPIAVYLSKYIPAGVVQPRTVKIDHIDIQGSAAAAKLTIDYPTHQFIDYFNLLKIEGNWLVVSKIFYRKAKS